MGRKASNTRKRDSRRTYEVMMIKTISHAMKVHERRKAAGLQGIGVAVRRFLKRNRLKKTAIGES